MPPRGFGHLVSRFPVASSWLCVSVFLVLCHFGGYSPRNDLDDLLKMVEIKNFLRTGNWFDRVIPGILQPEAFVSHWVRLVDLPYALVAAPLSYFVGREAALSAAAFAVPLILLFPLIHSYRRIVGTFGSARPRVFFALSLLFTLPALFEFEPRRIDYHNLEITLFFVALALTLASRRALAAACAGVITAVTLAISVEFAALFMVLMGLYALAYILDEEESRRRLASFGLGLAASALGLFFMIVPPGQYAMVRCDVYSAPHLVALASAGLAFAFAGGMAERPRSRLMRLVLLGVLASAAAIALVFLFPTCLGGPYGELSRYVKDNWLDRIPQERSLLQRPEVVLSAGMVIVALYMTGICALTALAWRDRLGHRGLAAFALLGLVILAESILYSRYLRYIDLFAGPGLLAAFATLRPHISFASVELSQIIPARTPSWRAFLVPVALLVIAIAVSTVFRAESQSAPASGAEFAEACSMGPAARLRWPRGASIFAPPNIGIQILAGEAQARATIVATPHHRAWKGIERVYRFFDPSTTNPRLYLDQAHATHVALCAWRGNPLTGLEKAYPMTAALLEGHPPSWLMECSLSPDSPIRVYRYPAAGGTGADCPVARQ